jgi:putative tryptophan/tyrosine transport system substrate-binding protein
VPATAAAAQAIGVALRIIEVPPEQDAAGILEEVRQWHPDALIVSPTPAPREAILGFAARNRLLAVYFTRGWVDSGGLMGYLPNGAETAERAARYVDRIFKGAKPADLPVEQPTRFELVVNLKTARAMGLELPSALLDRADEVIE